jgi:hypothetical protein
MGRVLLDKLGMVMPYDLQGLGHSMQSPLSPLFADNVRVQYAVPGLFNQVSCLRDPSRPLAISMYQSLMRMVTCILRLEAHALRAKILAASQSLALSHPGVHRALVSNCVEFH